jgi:GNAT superfamily N-acetyltransferase
VDRGASALRLQRPSDASIFVDRAGAFLVEREAENNLILGLCANLRAGRTYGSRPPYFAVVTEGDMVIGAAIRTPPLNLILAAGTDERSLPLILDDVAHITSELTGILGTVELARRAAGLWSARTGGDPRLAVSQRIYRLDRVKTPRHGPAAGSMRVATPIHRTLVAEWLLAFGTEALGSADPAAAKTTADWWIENGGLRLWVDGDPVAMAGASGPTPNGIRIGAVYTPRALRKRGYASTLVAELSQSQLDTGRRFCFLFTDLANPTSNKIYQDIGYEPVSDVDEYRFEESTRN